MILFGKTRAVFTHETLATAIENASVAINPALFALAAAALFVALASRFGAWPAALFTAFLGSLGDVNWLFQALRPGHQGFHVVFGAVSVVGLLFGGMGLVAPDAEPPGPWQPFRSPGMPDLRTAQRWFMLAGIGTGLALWVSATIESFFIYPMMAAVVVLLGLVPPARLAAEGLTVHPELWRRWGMTAGAVGFAFYLLEYFPHHMAMRIEVNHPIYDFAVVGSGETLCALSRWRWGGERPSRRRFALLAFWLTVSVLPVLGIAFGPIIWHHMRDPQMLRFHNFIQEFYTYRNFVQTNRLSHFLNLFGILPLVSLFTPVFLLRRQLTVPQVCWLWCTFVYACAFLVVACLQIRWMGFYAAAVCMSAMVTLHFAFSLLPAMPVARRQAAAWILVLALLVQPVVFGGRQIAEGLHDLHGRGLPSQVVTPILNKRMALALKASPARPRAIIADPDLAPSIGYFAEIPTLASFYWENLDGLHETVRFLATKDQAEAHEIAARTGATHVILRPSNMMPNYFYFIAYGHYDMADANNTFAAKLLQGKTPSWIQPDTVLNFITTDTYSYLGMPFTNRLESFRVTRIDKSVRHARREKLAKKTVRH